MKSFSKKILASSVGLLMMGGGCLQLTFAEEVSVLPALKSEAQSQQGYADGKLAKDVNLGALGNKSVIDTPFSVTTYTAKTIVIAKQRRSVKFLENDAEYSCNDQFRPFK